MSCEFCEKADFGNYSAKVDKYSASIYLAGGSGRFPKDEQFNFCPICGKRLKPAKPTPTEDEEMYARWAYEEFHHKWIARDIDGDLYVYEEKPEKEDIWWDNTNDETKSTQVNTDKYPFSFVKWEDAEPTYLPDLLGDCE